MKKLKACVPFALVTLALGCSYSDGVDRAAVHGEVIVDGEPLEQGSIDFFPVETNEGPSTGGIIEHGKYDIPRSKGPVVGRNRVEIHGIKKTGRMVPNAMGPDGMREEVVEALPPDVNIQSKLIREIARGSNVLDFTDLKGAPLPKDSERR